MQGPAYTPSADMMHTVIPARPPGTPMAADEIGIAYRIENEVATVIANTSGRNCRYRARRQNRRSECHLPRRQRR